MKQQTTVRKLILLFFALALTTVSFGKKFQTTEPGESLADTIETQPFCQLVSFTVKTVEGKNYINWCVKSRADNYYFVLERSYDGKLFSIVNRKKCFVSPVDHILQYSFVDGVRTNSEHMYYRISLHKIEAIDLEHKMIGLSPTNMFEMLENSIIVIESSKMGIALSKR